MSQVVDLLTEEEREIKAELEQVIDESLTALERLASAIIEYRDFRLWREEYSSWEDCAFDKWGIKKSRIQQILAGADTANVVKQLELPKGYENPSEGQLRPLAKKDIPDETKQAVYAAAVETASKEGKPVTGALVAKELENYYGGTAGTENGKGEEAEGVPPKVLLGKLRDGFEDICFLVDTALSCNNLESFVYSRLYTVRDQLRQGISCVDYVLKKEAKK